MENPMMHNLLQTRPFLNDKMAVSRELHNLLLDSGITVGPSFFAFCITVVSSNKTMSTIMEQMLLNTIRLHGYGLRDKNRAVVRKQKSLAAAPSLYCKQIFTLQLTLHSNWAGHRSKLHGYYTRSVKRHHTEKLLLRMHQSLRSKDIMRTLCFWSIGYKITNARRHAAAQHSPAWSSSQPRTSRQNTAVATKP